MDLALFEAAYPAKNWHRMTFACFQAYVDVCDVVHAILRGTYTEEQRRRLDLDRVNRQLLLQDHYNLYYPPMAEDEG